MPTVVDSLVLEFGLDPSKFSKGQKQVMQDLRSLQEQSRRGGKEIESEGKKLGEFFTSMKRSILGATAVFFGGKGIGEFTGFITKLDASTSRLSYTMNMNVRELSAWQGAMKQNGGTAESITSTLAALSGETNKFSLTGEASFLPLLNRLGVKLYTANNELKTADQLLLDVVSSLDEFKDPARKAAMLNMLPGMNPDSLNLLIQGRQAVEAYLRTARQIPGVTDESAAVSKKYQQETANLERSMTGLGRSVAVIVLPAINAVANSLTRLFSPIAGGKVVGPEATRAGLVKKYGSPRRIMEWLAGQKWAFNDKDSKRILDLADEWYGKPGADEAAARGDSKKAAQSSHEDYIRDAARRRGIDPDVAVSVARSEGLGGKYVGDRGSSFGDFQLHYGGVASGGMAVGGLGDKFTKTTGLNARDPNTWQQQVDFALDEAKRSGWGAWHGWKGAPWAGIGGASMPGASSAATSSSVNIGTINIHTEGGDADSIARSIDPAIRRSYNAAPANFGQQ